MRRGIVLSALLCAVVSIGASAQDIEPNRWIERTPDVIMLEGREGVYKPVGDGNATYDSLRGETLFWESYVEGPPFYCGTIYARSLYSYNALDNELKQLKLNNWYTPDCDINQRTCPIEPDNTIDPTPSDRHQYGQFVYVPSRDAVYIYSGSNNSLDYECDGGPFDQRPEDTWYYDMAVASWTELFPAENPGVVLEGCMGLDPQRDKIVLATNNFVGTWVYDIAANTWTEADDNQVAPRASCRMAYDSTRERVVLFGGGPYRNPNNDLYEFDFDTETWNQLVDCSTQVCPPGRGRHGWAYDSKNDVFMVYGGTDRGDVPIMDDTWLYHPQTNTWEELTLPATPGGASHTDMAYDESADMFVLTRDEEFWVFRVCDGDDTDGDGVCDAGDNCPSVANADQADFDSDGEGDVCDACTDSDADGSGDPGFSLNTCPLDNCPSDPNPGQEDIDSDGLGDACDDCTDTDGDGFGNPGFPSSTCADDNCPAIPNPGQDDGDSDGTGDACDACPADAQNDIDGDGVCGDVDNCPNNPNPGQQDSDGDGVGDVCDGCSDSDDDGVCDDVDNCPATSNPGQQDGDGDGQGDACDACPADAANDADGDGVCGDVDNCPATSNPGQQDGDGDGQGDACDACPADAANDADGDGVCGDVDNCPATSNPGQQDGDGDGQGDACDACPADAQNDADGDGVCGDVDNCPATSNPGQQDGDGDGQGDACDACPADAQNDADGDGVCGDVDNCPATSNPGQQDVDGDGQGDACDACPADAANDADGDGVCGNVDNCPVTSNPGQQDGDGDGQGDACDACPADAQNDADGDGVCGDVDNCPLDANPGQEDGDGDGIGDACDVADPVDQDGDGLEDGVDPCPADARNRCFGPVALDGTTGHAIRVNSGSLTADCGGMKVDCDGDRWFPDFGALSGRESTCENFSPPCSFSGVEEVFGCDSAATEDLYQCLRWQRGRIIYRFDVADGNYLVNLLLAQSDGAGPGERVYDIVVEGEVRIDDFDPAVAGPAFSAMTRAVPVMVSDGDGIQIEIVPQAGRPQLRGLELLASVPQGGCQSDADCVNADPCVTGQCDLGSGACFDVPLPDGDLDATCDVEDNCPLDPNPGQEDGDGDGLGDICDACPADAQNDVDGDGVCGDIDNCPATSNPGQEDTDGDGIGDACDGCDDADADGVCDTEDNCPVNPNPGQEDADGDGAGDACDPCPADAQNDIDGDGVCGDVDNCPVDANPGQEDSDGDGIGDACDVGGGPTDDDNDGLFGTDDPCPTDARNRCFGPVAQDAGGQIIRLNSNAANDDCSGTRFDCNGDLWVSDFGYNTGRNGECDLPGGCPIEGISEIFGCEDNDTEDLFQCNRWDQTSGVELQYSFNLSDGTYLVNLFFANALGRTDEVGDRLFDVYLEGAIWLDDFDQILAAGGSARAVVRSAIIQVSDGNGLQIDFDHVFNNPDVKAIEVLRQEP